MKPELAALISEALEQLVSDGVLAEVPESAPQIDRPKDTSHGDLSCNICLLYTSPSPRDRTRSRMPSSA